MRSLPIVVASLLLSSLTSSGCTRRPHVCEDGSATAPLCRRIEALEHQLAEQAEAAASVRTHHDEQDARIGTLEARLVEAQDQLELAMPIGVPACDLYIARYSRCIDEKMPEFAQETSHRALQTSARAWRKAAQTAAGREGLAVACRTASAAVERSCGWK